MWIAQNTTSLTVEVNHVQSFVDNYVTTNNGSQKTSRKQRSKTVRDVNKATECKAKAKARTVNRKAY